MDQLMFLDYFANSKDTHPLLFTIYGEEK